MNLEKNYISFDSLFFDTYAFCEILKGNINYKKYESYSIVTCKINIFELYLSIYREVGEKEANSAFDKYFPFVFDFNEEVIKEAAKLKIAISKRDVSMTDCIGYCLAKQLGVRFLTGDGAFKGMDNVEFVL